MLIQTWGEVLTASLQNLWWAFASFVPMLLLAIVIFVIGWLIASVVGKAFTQVVASLKLDKLFASAGADQVFARAGVRLNIAGFVGALVKWFIVLVFLMASLDMLNLTVVNQFLRDVVVAYIPQVIVAALVLAIAAIVSNLARRVIVASAKAAHVPSSGVLGSVVYYAIWIFATIIALSHLGIASGYMQVLFSGIVAMLAIAFGLSFGLGGKEAAARAIEHFRGGIRS